MNTAQIRAARNMRPDHSDSAIAARLGVSRQHIHATLGPRPKRKPVHKPAPPPGPSREEFAAALLAWRTARGLSQAQAAALLRVNPQTISFWETGRNGCALAASIMLLMELIS